jgi:hypoxanthine phosphoribosyltransferase
MEEVNIKGMNFSIFISAAQIEKALIRIATHLNEQFAGKNPVFVSVLNGSFMFTADLLKKVTIPCEVSFVKLASYQGTQSTGIVKQLVGLTEDIENRSVIILEDIVDTGFTMQDLLQQLGDKNPKEITVVTLLQKPDALQVPLQVHHVGFEIPNAFVVGYGLDLDGFGRNLPHIYQLKSE